MWNHARAPRPGGIGIASGIRHLLCILDLALQVRRERRMLLSLDDRALKDIGLSRSEVWAEACRPLWEIHHDRLWLCSQPKPHDVRWQ